MAYDFESLQQRVDEAIANPRYYTDFGDIDPNVLHEIQELLNFIRTKGSGRAFREAVAQLFERYILTVSMQGNANLEVSVARGTFKTLKDRLDNLDLTDDNLEKAIALIQGQISSLIANAGNTETNTELLDIRLGNDGKNYSTAGMAVRTQLNNMLGISTQVLGSPSVSGEYIYRSNGRPVANTYYNRSELIDIGQFTKLYLVASTNNDNAGYAFFDKYRVLISSSDSGDGTLKAQVINVPVGAKYFMFSTLTKDASLSKVYGQLKTIKPEIDTVAVNEVELSYSKVDGYFIDVTGKITANAGYYYSEPINVKQGEKLIVYNQDNSNAGIASISEWTSSDTFVGPIVPGSIAGQTVEYIVPKDMIIKICGWKLGVMRVFKRTVSVENIVVTDIQKKLNLAVNKPQTNFAIGIGKTIMIGDSLTSGAYDDTVFNGKSINQNMPFYFEKLTTNEVKNAGVSGIYPSKWLSDEFPKYNFLDYDSVYIWLGTNLGLTDTMDADVNGYSNYTQYANTETGSYCKLIEMIKEQNPDISIHMSKIFAGNGVVDQTNKVIEQIATKYGIHLIDLSDLTKANYPQYHHDIGATHLNKAGNIFVANRLFNETNAYFDNNYFKLEFGLTARTN